MDVRMTSPHDVDNGWAWMALAASYFNQLVTSGLAFVAGMFQVVFLEEFNGSVALTSWVTGLFSALLQLAGPMASLMSNTFGCRTTVMLGGALLASGFVIGGLANSLELLMVTFGAVAGLGMGLTYIPSIVVINYYFDKRRTLVNGIASSAGGLGILLAPQVSQFLFDNFSWREALFILAGVAAHICIAGALMFPMHESPKVKNVLCCGKHEGMDRFDVLRDEKMDSKTDGKFPSQSNHKTTVFNVDYELNISYDDSDEKSYTGKTNGSKVSGCKTGDLKYPLDDVMRSRSINDVPNSHRQARSSENRDASNVDNLGNNLSLENSCELSTSVCIQVLPPTNHMTNGDASSDIKMSGMDDGNSKGINFSESATKNVPDQEMEKSDTNSIESCGMNSNLSNIPAIPQTALTTSDYLYTSLSKSDGDDDDNNDDDDDENDDDNNDVKTKGKANGCICSKTVTCKGNDSLDNESENLGRNGINFRRDLNPNIVDEIEKDGCVYNKLESGQDFQFNDTPDSKQLYSNNKSDIKHSVDEKDQKENSDSQNLKSPSIPTDNYPPLYRNVPFLLLCLSLFVNSAGSGSFLIHVPSFLKSREFSQREVTNILSINGVAILIGRCMLGGLVNHYPGNESLFLIAMQIIGGIFMALFPVIGTNFGACMGLMFAVGAYCGTFYSLLPTLTILYVGLAGLSTAFGIEMVCCGLGYLIAPPLAGVVVDVTGNYDFNMYGGGVLFVLAGMNCMLLPVLPRWKRQSREMKPNSDPLS